MSDLSRKSMKAWSALNVVGCYGFVRFSMYVVSGGVRKLKEECICTTNKFEGDESANLATRTWVYASLPLTM